VAAAAAAVATQSPRTTTSTQGGDGKQRTVVKVELAMATDYLNEKAAQYKHLVAEFSKVFQIEEPLIYAVMEQESRFNPQAKSHVPAYGLMQLVPSSGGCDAYTYVKKLKQPTHVYMGTRFGLDRPSMLMAEQLFTVDKSSLLRYIGTVDSAFLQEANRALNRSIGLCPEYPGTDHGTNRFRYGGIS
jgi:mRNA-degrading endonuclease toxin of MazEF toxin-antitoxin module